MWCVCVCMCARVRAPAQSCTRVYVRNWAKRQRGLWEPPSDPPARGGGCLPPCVPCSAGPWNPAQRSLRLWPRALETSKWCRAQGKPCDQGVFLYCPASIRLWARSQPARACDWMRCGVLPARCGVLRFGEKGMNEQGLGVTTAVKDPMGTGRVRDGLPCLGRPPSSTGVPSRPRTPSASAGRCRPVPCSGRPAR